MTIFRKMLAFYRYFLIHKLQNINQKINSIEKIKLLVDNSDGLKLLDDTGIEFPCDILNGADNEKEVRKFLHEKLGAEVWRILARIEEFDTYITFTTLWGHRTDENDEEWVKRVLNKPIRFVE